MFYVREPLDFGLHTTPTADVINAAAPKKPDYSLDKGVTKRRRRASYTLLP